MNTQTDKRNPTYPPINTTPIGRVTYEEFTYMRGIVAAELDRAAFETAIWMYLLLMRNDIIPRNAKMIIDTRTPIHADQGFSWDDVRKYCDYLDRLKAIDARRLDLDKKREFAKPGDHHQLEYPEPLRTNQEL